MVLIKPNVAVDRPAALGATTHPDTLAAVARLARESAHHASVLGRLSGSSGDPWHHVDSGGRLRKAERWHCEVVCSDGEATAKGAASPLTIAKATVRGPMPIGAASSRLLAARRWNAHRFRTVSKPAKDWLLLKTRRVRQC